jgi:5-methyltetrahydrofolate--homocysteine methyltransferase
MPKTSKDRMVIADRLVTDLTSSGVKENDIFLDPLVKPISTSDNAGLEVLETIRYIKEKYPKVHTICGLSNVSFGLPNRKVLNHTFMIQTMTMGMNAYILNPLDKKMMGFIYSSMAMLGRDPFCGKYLMAYRKGIYNE